MATQEGLVRVVLEIWCVLGLGLALIIAIRNGVVYRYRNRLIQQVSEAAKADIGRGHYWFWRYDAYNEVSYDEMVWQFWRKCDSFYPDRRFLE